MSLFFVKAYSCMLNSFWIQVVFPMILVPNFFSARPLRTCRGEIFSACPARALEDLVDTLVVRRWRHHLGNLPNKQPIKQPTTKSLSDLHFSTFIVAWVLSNIKSTGKTLEDKKRDHTCNPDWKTQLEEHLTSFLMPSHDRDCVWGYQWQFQWSFGIEWH